MSLLCNCLLSLNVFNIGLPCNLRFLSTTVLQGSVATWVNDGCIFNDFFIANLLLIVMVKEFWRSVRIWQSYGKKLSGTFFFRTRCSDSELIRFVIKHAVFCQLPTTCFHWQPCTCNRLGLYASSVRWSCDKQTPLVTRATVE